MQQPSANTAPALALLPAPCGWLASAVTALGETSTQEVPSFAEAVTAGFALTAELRLDKTSPKQIPVSVALSTRLAVFERLTLPSSDLDELAGMVRLQFEKSLPYPTEETVLGFQIVAQKTTTPPANPEGEPAKPLTQTTLLACGAHHAAIAALCSPLLEHQYPQRVTLWAMNIAAQAPADEVACGLWQEEGDLVFAIFENRRLGFVEILASPEDALAALPRALMSAEMAGAPVAFREALLDPSLAALAQPLSAFLGAPVRELTLSHPGELPEGDAVDLTPEAWIAEQSRKERMRKRRKQIAIVASIYGVILLAATAYLGIQGSKLDGFRREALALQPRVDTVIEQQTRWKTFAPAVDPQRFAVELLFQACQSLPTLDARITRFELIQSQLTIEGETPNAQQAIEFVEKLKARPELADFRFEAAPPRILQNEHAQYRIFGK